MIIRQERPEDYDTVYHVVKEAFEVDDESFMALNLNGSQNKLNGVIEYDKAYGI